MDLITESSHLLKQTNLLCKSRLREENALDVARHRGFIEEALRGLPPGYTALDASRPWIIYWCLQSLSVLGEDVTSYRQRVVATLRTMQSKGGGFGGNFCHVPHLAPTYAAVNAIAIVGGSNAYESIDRPALYKWMLSLKQSNGGFAMHHGGEVDARSAYCAMSIASLLGMMTPELTRNVAEWIRECQTFEGGIACSPGSEAHGGYVFCALAALSILDTPVKITAYLNVASLERWLIGRQTPEGGFSGRSNKLVDGCYSWWVGGCWALLGAARKRDMPWNREALVKYVLRCCQTKYGGLRDKPGKHPDQYHTCYCLSGLSAAKYVFKLVDDSWTYEPSGSKFTDDFKVEPLHPVYVLPWGKAEGMQHYFRQEPAM